MNRYAALVVMLMMAPLVVPAADSRKAVGDRAIQSLSGREVYAQSCAMCHTAGVGGAPRPGRAEEWSERLKSGPADLLISVLRGKGGMPPKGGNASLTRVEAYLALDFMLNGEK